MPRFALRAAALSALVLATAACDTTGGTEPLGGILYVSLESATVIRLESELDLPCGPRIVTEQQLRGGRFEISVLGVEPTPGGCTAIAPVTRSVTIQSGSATTLPVDIVYGGFVDEYRYTAARPGVAAARLDSVRTDVTRPGRRPR